MKINKYLKLLLVPTNIEVIAIAIELKLFDLLHKKQSLDKLAKELECDSKNLEILLHSLVLQKLIKSKKGLYENSSFSNKYLLSSSEFYFGDIFLFRKNYLEKSNSNLYSLVKKGYKKDKNPYKQEHWAEVSSKYFYQEQKVLSSKFVVKLVKDLKEYQAINKILDLGCSSGVLGLELVKSHPSMKGILFDFQEVVEVAKENISNYNLEDRVSVLGGNIELDEIGKGYDLIFCSNVLLLIDDKKKILEKIYNALNPDGVFISIHTDIAGTSKQDKNSYLYILASLMQGNTMVDAYEFSKLILDSKFKSVNSFTAYNIPLSPTTVHIAKR